MTDSLSQFAFPIFFMWNYLNKDFCLFSQGLLMQEWLFRLGPHHILHPIYTRFCLLKRLCLQSNPGIFAPFFWKKKISIFDTKTRVGPNKAWMNLLFFYWRVKLFLNNYICISACPYLVNRKIIWSFAYYAYLSSLCCRTCWS